MDVSGYGYDQHVDDPVGIYGLYAAGCFLSRRSRPADIGLSVVADTLLIIIDVSRRTWPTVRIVWS